MKLWQWLMQEEPPPPPADPIHSRGRYLVDALGHCGECHTPRTWAGVSDRSRYLAGSKNGPEGESVPNITPYRGDGLGKWDAEDLAYFLESGELPNGDYAGSLMAEVIDNSTSKLTASDRRAMVEYLRSIPAIPGT
jgi:mono/diheme cytochrome c family protein